MKQITDYYEPKGEIAKLFQWALVDRAFPQGEITEFLCEGPAGSGKSRALGELIYSLMGMYPRWRGLVVRKTRSSLTESWMATWETKVLWPGHPMLAGAKRTNRHSYENATTGASLVMGGMDEPTKLFSTEWDFVLYEECHQANQDEWEKFRRALRNWATPFQLLIGNINPVHPRFFLNERCMPPKDGRAPKCNRIVTRHADNPSLKPAYLDSLSKNTGLRYKRLFLGLWCAPEGAIFPEYEADKHLKFRNEVPYHPAIHKLDPEKSPRILEFYGAMDWGHSAPCAFTAWGLDDLNRLWMVAEVYRTKVSIPGLCEMVAEMDKRFKFKRIFCDPSQPAMIDLFNVSISDVRGHTAREGAPVACKGVNETRAGLEAIRERLVGGKEGPTLFIMHDALIHAPEADLIDIGKPTCLAGELEEYVYARPPEGQPINERNSDQEDKTCAAHAIDTARYVCLTLMRSDERIITKPKTYEAGTLGDLAGFSEIFDDDFFTKHKPT